MNGKELPLFLQTAALPLGWADVWNTARTLRAKYWENTVYLRGIIEFSNYCRQNCWYCGLRRDNRALFRYRMTPDAIFAAAQAASRLGLGTVVLQAGEDPAFSAVEIATCVARIKKELGLAVTLSVGEHDKAVYALWREAGADRYLLKIESANEANYARLRPGKTLASRLDCLADLAALGYELGTGFITGLPGEAEDDFARGLDLLAELKPDMLSLGPFVPHPETPLRHAPSASATMNLHCLAQARICLPWAHIPVTSALGLYGDNLRLAALEVANVLMPSFTPEEVRQAYSIYPGKNADARGPEQRTADFSTMLVQAGFVLGPGTGGAWRRMKMESV